MQIDKTDTTVLSKDGSLLAVFKQIISEEPGVGESNQQGNAFEVSAVHLRLGWSGGSLWVTFPEFFERSSCYFGEFVASKVTKQNCMEFHLVC